MVVRNGLRPMQRRFYSPECDHGRMSDHVAMGHPRQLATERPGRLDRRFHAFPSRRRFVRLVEWKLKFISNCLLTLSLSLFLIQPLFNAVFTLSILISTAPSRSASLLHHCLRVRSVPGCSLHCLPQSQDPQGVAASHPMDHPRLHVRWVTSYHCQLP